MSSYHSSFSYLGQNSAKSFGWIICHFDPDNGETDSYLSQEQVYTNSHNGAKRILYGTRWNSVANVKMTVIKQDGSDFTLGECREAYKWLTGNPEASWMDLYIGDEVKYRLLCTIQDVKPQKMDARTVGLNIYCESLSPWAYSPMQKVVQSVNDESKTFSIDNQSDDLYDFVYLKTTYENSGDSKNALIITNTTTNETTQVTNLSTNEIITIDGNHMITSNKPSKFFGNSFNFVFPRLKAGVNEFVVEGMGRLTFEYYYPIKMGDCAQNINIVRDPICDDFGNIQVDTLPWERVSNTPTTLSGYGITDAYTKAEVDSTIAGLDVDQTYNPTSSNAQSGVAVAQAIDIIDKAKMPNVSDFSRVNAVGEDVNPEILAHQTDDPSSTSLIKIPLNLIRKPADSKYNPESENAQSGKAIAEALADIDIESDFIRVEFHYLDDITSYQFDSTKTYQINIGLSLDHIIDMGVYIGRYYETSDSRLLRYNALPFNGNTYTLNLDTHDYSCTSIAASTVDISEKELNNMLVEVLGE